MKVAINAQLLPSSGMGGVETVLLGLVNALHQLKDGSDEYVIIGPWEDPEWLKPYIGANQRIVRGPRVESLKRLMGPIKPILRMAGIAPKSSLGKARKHP